MIKRNTAILSPCPCNTGRQMELDIGKAFPILCLAFVHCTIECCSDEQLLTGIPYLFDSVIGGPMSAPMFLFCMGATVHYAKEQSPKKLALRGLKLVLFGFLLNLCRFLLPYLLGYALTHDAGQFLVPLPYRIFGNDVLQFAGVASLILALWMRWKMPKWTMLALSLAFSVVGTLVRGTDLGNDALNIAGGWLFGTVNEADQIISDFPVLNWLIIPVSGYCFGWLLLRVRDKRRLYLRFAPALLALAAVGLYFGIRFEIGMFGEGQNAYYHLYTHDALLCLALTLGLLGVWAALAHVLPKPVLRFFTYTSRNITAFYCIHWVFVRLSTNVIVYAVTGTQLLPLWATMLLSLGIVLLTFLTLRIYRVLHPKENHVL